MGKLIEFGKRSQIIQQARALMEELESWGVEIETKEPMICAEALAQMIYEELHLYEEIKETTEHATLVGKISGIVEEYPELFAHFFERFRQSQSK